VAPPKKIIQKVLEKAVGFLTQKEGHRFLVTNTVQNTRPFLTLKAESSYVPKSVITRKGRKILHMLQEIGDTVDSEDPVFQQTSEELVRVLQRRKKALVPFCLDVIVFGPIKKGFDVLFV